LDGTLPIKCYHCHLLVPEGLDFSLITDEGKTLPMCCPGCKAVTDTILKLGLSQFYQYRDKFPDKPMSLIPEELGSFSALDNPAVYNDFVSEQTDDEHSHQTISLYIDGITCSACVWLLENRIRELQGVKSCVVNLSNHLALIRWDKNQLKLSQLFLEISKLGYTAELSRLQDIDSRHKSEGNQALKRIGVAGLGAMQVMMIAVGLYAGGVQGMGSEYKHFLRWISLIVTLPVFFYVGKPFIKSAARSIKSKQLGMDVPIAIAIIAIMIQSLLSTLTGRGEIYYDSVCMFLFFLTLGRYLEMRARHKGSDLIGRLGKRLPLMAVLVDYAQGKIVSKKLVSISSLKTGDILWVDTNQNIPADGILLDSNTRVNEAMLTGEFMPKSKRTGDFIYAGTKNIAKSCLMKVTQCGEKTKLSAITRLLTEAQSARGKSISLANKIAGYFVGFVLFFAFLSGAIWSVIDSHQALWVMLSVLVISCPCALSLATPIVLTVSMNKLSELGFLVINNRVIEGMSAITHCVFDKTGTLTEGELALDRIELLSTMNEEEVLSISGSLEAISTHPIGLAISTLLNNRKLSLMSVTDPKEVLNCGVSGVINGMAYRLGKHGFASSISQLSAAPDKLENQTITVFLANQNGPIASFHFKDKIRSHVKETVDWLKSQSIKPIMLTGDASHTAAHVAKSIGIDCYYAEKSPSEKLEIINQLSDKQHHVLVIGDGSNDVLAMARADLAFSMGSGTDLAKTHSDAVLMNNDISLLKTIFEHTASAKTIIKQNISWAIAYNVIALPVAAFGLVVPYVAVIGMSVSSLLVTFNALRLKRTKIKPHITPSPHHGLSKATLIEETS
jgi:Cu2+-exporting ATPase